MRQPSRLGIWVLDECLEHPVLEVGILGDMSGASSTTCVPT